MKLDCVFCKIVNNEVKALKVYESEDVLAFLDVNPVSLGHTLIIPKKHYVCIFDIPDEILKEIISVSKMLAKTYREKLNITGVNILHASGKDAQQSVFHFHIHLIPRYPNDGLDLWIHKYPRRKVRLEEAVEKIMRERT